MTTAPEPHSSPDAPSPGSTPHNMVGISDEMKAKNQKAGKVMIGVIVVMFLFGFASIPLYRIFCTAVDPGGSAYSADLLLDKSGAPVAIDKSRTVSVRLTSTVNASLPWEFKHLTNRVELHPGERQHVKFFARNTANVAVRGKAVYDIVPAEAGQYLKKIECFCFQEQKLEPGESVEMPLVFWFEPDMPAHIQDITLAYTFFNMESSMQQSLRKAN